MQPCYVASFSLLAMELAQLAPDRGHPTAVTVCGPKIYFVFRHGQQLHQCSIGCDELTVQMLPSALVGTGMACFCQDIVEIFGGAFGSCPPRTSS